MELDKTDFKIHKEKKMCKNSQDNSVEKQRWGDALPDIKPYYKSMIMKIVWLSVPEWTNQWIE